MNHELILALGVVSLLMLSVVAALFSRHRFMSMARSGIPNGLKYVDAGIYFTFLYLLFFLLEPVLVILDVPGTGYYLAWLSEDSRLYYASIASIVGFIGYVFFVFGYTRKPLTIIRAIPVLHINDSSNLSKLILMLLYFSISLVGFWYYGAGNIEQMLLNPEDRMEDASGTGYAFFLVQFYLSAILVLYALDGQRGRYPRVFRAILWIAPIGMVVFGGRTDVAQIWLCLFFIYLIKNNGVKLTKIIYAALLMALFLSMALVYRKSSFGSGGLESEDALTILGLVGWALRHALVPFDNFASYLHVHHGNYPYLLGLPFIDIVFQLIPSSWINSKPIEPGIMLAGALYPGVEGGTPFTIVGFYFANIDIAGVMVGMFATGYLLRVLHQYFLLHRREMSVVVIYSFILSRLIIVIWGVYYSGVLGYAQFFMQFILAFMVLIAFRRLRRGSVQGGIV